MEFVEFTGKSVDEAITNALLALETTTDNLEYEVIEKGSEGLLSLFNKKSAKIRARKREVVEETPVVTSTTTTATVNESVTVASSISPASIASIQEKVKDFLTKMFAAMDMTVEISMEMDEVEDQLNINLSGEEMGLLIGKRGQTLDSIQYIVSLMINKTEEKYIKVKVDTEEYRKRRKETLESLAKNIAIKVKKTRKSMSLEPMNPYERRIIHSTLQNDKFVTTKSEGEEPFRHVIVSLKPSANRYYNPSSKYGNSRYGSKYNKYGSRYNNEEGKEGSEGGSRYNNRYNGNRYTGRYNGYKKNYNNSERPEATESNNSSEE